MNMCVTPSQGVVGDVGERGPPGPDGKEVRTVKCCPEFTALVSCPSEEPLLLLLSYSFQMSSNDFFKI